MGVPPGRGGEGMLKSLWGFHQGGGGRGDVEVTVGVPSGRGGGDVEVTVGVPPGRGGGRRGC